jgi:hypothetical protein
VHFFFKFSFIFDTQFIFYLCAELTFVKGLHELLNYSCNYEHALPSTQRHHMGSTQFHKQKFYKRNHGDVTIVYVAQEMPVSVISTSV